MGITAKIFAAISDLALAAKKREAAEYDEFMQFYRDLVETVPSDVVKIFGRINVEVQTGKERKNYGLELTATDFAWWRHEFDTGTRFVSSPAGVKHLMVARMASQAEQYTLEAEDRKKLLNLLEQTR